MCVDVWLVCVCVCLRCLAAVFVSLCVMMGVMFICCCECVLLNVVVCFICDSLCDCV